MAYINYSMSVRAAGAYQEGLKPKSKWTKADIIAECEKADIQPDILELLKATKAPLLAHLLKYAEWHHTSKFYNDTDFYRVDTEYLEDVTAGELAAFFNRCAVHNVAKEYKARCRFLEWSGTRKHPKATECEEIGFVRGNWFYRSNGSKKSINANGFKIIEKL